MPRPKRAVPIDRYVVMTLAEVGQRLGISAMRVYQIEREAIKKLRNAFIAKGIMYESGRRKEGAECNNQMVR